MTGQRLSWRSGDEDCLNGLHLFSIIRKILTAVALLPCVWAAHTAKNDIIRIQFGRSDLSSIILSNPHSQGISLGTRRRLFVQDSSRTFPPLLKISGGALVDDGDETYSEELDESDDDADFDMLADDMDFLDDGSGGGDMMYFDESNWLQRASELWKTTPPFTKAYISASIVTTAVGYVINKQTHEFPKFFLLDWKAILFRGQIWRLVTAFFNFGPFGFGYVMTAHFVWTYMSTLEKLHHNKPYDFWIMILFGAASMVVGYTLLGISPKFLGHNLSTYLVYIWSRYHEGMDVNVMELFNARAETLPWFFLAQTALLEGELPLLDILGIVFGHIYHYAKVAKILVTPKSLVQWYNDPTHPLATKIRKQYQEISSDFEL